MKPLPFINDPNFHGIFFRTTTRQLRGAGGLWPEAKKMYAPFNPTAREGEMTITFPSGATLAFCYMEHENDKEKHQGLQYSFIGADEGSHFSETQITYLLSRLRSEAKNDSFCMISCNPDPDSWLRDWVDWYLDEEGYPDKKKSGVIRYYIVDDGKPIFADTAEELLKDYKHILEIEVPDTGEIITVPPKSFTFICGSIFDNPILIKKNPKYLSELKALPEVERARLLDGNWNIRAKGATFFSRDWLQKADEVPKGSKACRAWDKASMEPSEKERFPDYTASAKIWKSKDGLYYLTGDYHHSNTDGSDHPMGRFRKSIGTRDKLIENQARHDGSDCTVVFSVDPAQAGKVEFQESAKKLIQEGFIVKADPSPPTSKKIVRFEPFSAACENGLVYIVESTFEKQTLEAIYRELEMFNGERSTRKRKDDWPDAYASAFNFICRERVIPSFSIHSETSSNPFKVK